jgi:hypothetical protein
MLFPVPAFDPAYTTPLAALTNPGLLVRSPGDVLIPAGR